MKLKALAVFALAVIGLTGCVQSAAPTVSNPSPTSPAAQNTVPPTNPTTTATTDPTETPTTQPPGSAKPALSDLVITGDGLLPLKVTGLAQKISEETGSIIFNNTYCSDAGVSTADPGRWLANYPDVDSFYSDKIPPFFLEVANGHIFRIDITGVGIQDANGIGIGSTRAQLLAKYPELAASSPWDGPVSDVYVLQLGSGNQVIYEVTRHDEGVSYWPDYQQDKVLQIRVLQKGIDPNFATAASDNIAGAC